MTRVLFLACFGVGDFSVLQGRHALASPSASLTVTSAPTTRALHQIATNHSESADAFKPALARPFPR